MNKKLLDIILTSFYNANHIQNSVKDCVWGMVEVIENTVWISYRLTYRSFDNNIVTSGQKGLLLKELLK